MRPKVYFSKNQRERIRKAMLAGLASERLIDAGQIQGLKIERKNMKDNGYWMLASGFTVDEFGNRDRIWILESEEHLRMLLGIIKKAER